MTRDFKAFEIKMAFAYNSAFDEKVFDFNCDWFKCINPFDNIEIKDIRGFAHYFLVDDNYKAFCEENSLFTETGNYSTTAETMTRYLLDSNDFIEAHTALADSEIEMEILFASINKGADINENYKAFKTIPREQEKPFKVKYYGETIFEITCKSATFRRTDNTVLLR